MLPLGQDALFKKSIHILSIRYFDKATCECVTNDSNAQNNGCNILNLLKIFALTHFEIHIKKILVTCAVMQRCFDLEVSARENCPFHPSILLVTFISNGRTPDRKRNLKCAVARQLPSGRDFIQILSDYIGTSEARAVLHQDFCLPIISYTLTNAFGG